MGPVSYELMRQFCIDHYIQRPGAIDMPVLDVGSYNVNGCHRPLFPGKAKYYGLDIRPGKNVDVVAEDPYHWPLDDAFFDIIISANTFEHIEYPWETMREISRVAKPGARICIVVPSAGEIHQYPIDTYRYNPDGMEALRKWAGLEELEATIHDDREEWKYVVAKFRKPE